MNPDPLESLYILFYIPYPDRSNVMDRIRLKLLEKFIDIAHNICRYVDISSRSCDLSNSIIKKVVFAREVNLRTR